MWHDRDIDFARWLHPAMWHVALESWQWIHEVAAPYTMWYVALGWHAIEFAQTSAISEFYIWFRFRPHHRSRYVILHQSHHPRQKKMTSCLFSRWRISAILYFMDLWKTQLQLTKLLTFQKITFLHFRVKIQDGRSPPSWILWVP